ncbi:pantoate--beta-alanine ligase [Hyphobacterium sp. HN65]|uniref:Pantothenate synthetase n=1 Tax=Hyphobacterium lacteum TaxID=3116575 RepID=A0ABU7LNG3_9PROT|nr:pantoate--beta-alanine ligase [Hyphobacterium sp. HN65]MEE2525151.1 pantoate--beta-alanine ligase [Hyphobacterium sp. HN65]
MSDLSALPVPATASTDELRSIVADWRRAGLRIGFVPTMGALHEGHLSLIRMAHENADKVVASIFVNPTQFAPHEDFDAYPRTLDEDAAKLANAKCDLLYAPLASEMYPEGFSARLTVEGPARGLESDFRPHFFGGVAIVVAKLFNRVQPDIAVFGEKDYQQLLVIRQMVRDLDLPIGIIPGPTLRERDGLALSSRNAYLSTHERDVSAGLNVILKDFASDLSAGTDWETAQGKALAKTASAFDRVDYIEARCAETLAPLPAGPVRQPARVLAAVWLGKTRLIDNLPVEQALPGADFE